MTPEYFHHANMHQQCLHNGFLIPTLGVLPQWFPHAKTSSVSAILSSFQPQLNLHNTFLIPTPAGFLLATLYLPILALSFFVISCQYWLSICNLFLYSISCLLYHIIPFYHIPSSIDLFLCTCIYPFRNEVLKCSIRKKGTSDHNRISLPIIAI